MKALTPIAFLSALFTFNAQADIVVCAPSMSAHQEILGHSINKSIDLGEHWRYVVTGVEWRLNAGTPIDGKIKGTDLLTKNNQYFTGSTTLSLSIGSKSIIHGASLMADSIDDYSSGEETFDEPIVLENQNVVLNCLQSSNMVNDHGSYVVLKGYSVELPPEPIGNLEADKVVAVGSEFCNISWTIKRAGVRAYAPDLPDPGDYTVVDAKQPTNKGHGNNADGVDADNPGKAAQVWRDKGHIISDDNFSGVDNDEGGGNGAAPSH